MKKNFHINSHGWLDIAPGIRILESPNFDLRPKKTDLSLIVIHSISLPEGQFGLGNVEKLFLNQLDINDRDFEFLVDVTVSSHFFIDRIGETVQFVSVYKRAWHAGISNFLGDSDCNNFSVGIELEGSDKENFTKDQYESLFNLVHCLQHKVPTIGSVASHSFIAPDRKTDPGPHFNWDYFKSLLQKKNVCLKFFP